MSIPGHRLCARVHAYRDTVQMTIFRGQKPAPIQHQFPAALITYSGAIRKRNEVRARIKPARKRAHTNRTRCAQPNDPNCGQPLLKLKRQRPPPQSPSHQFGLLMPGVGKGQVVAGRTGAGAEGAGAAATGAAGLLATTAGFLAAGFLAAAFFAGAAFLATAFLAAGFLAAAFFAGAAFLAAGFFAAGFFAAGLAFFATTISTPFFVKS